MRPDQNMSVVQRLSVADDHLARAEETLALAEEVFNDTNIAGYGILIESHIRLAEAYLHTVEVKLT